MDTPAEKGAADSSYDSSINSTLPNEVESTEDLNLSTVRSATGGNPAAGVTTNIADGDVDVTVNLPIEVTFANGISSSDVNSNNFYLLNSSNLSIPVRLIQEGNTVIMIPQIKEQPKGTYTAVLMGHTITFTNEDLDYGLYWYGKYGYCEKYFAEYDNAYYDPSKKTMVYAHGWQPDAVTQEDVYGRQNFGYELFFWAEDDFGTSDQYNGLRKWTNHSWIDQGWNTGFVYWNQFSDEPTASEGNIGGVHDAEAKIWSFDGYQGNRYRTIDASGNAVYKNWDQQLTFNGQTINVDSVGELLSYPVNHALAGNYSGNIRFVGHSLGNQLATDLSFRAFQAGIDTQRIALLDPAWTGSDKDYLPNDGYGTWVGERVRNYIFEMQDDHDVAVEIYHTTGMNVGTMGVTDENEPLTDVVCDVFVLPWYYSATQLDGKHVSIRHTYLWGMEYQPPVECHISWWRRRPTGNVAASASTPSWRIHEMMTTESEWAQVEGRYTPSPEDDWFEKKTKENDMFTLW